jgi:AmiR/NasT family two-component response regulator
MDRPTPTRSSNPATVLTPVDPEATVQPEIVALTDQVEQLRMALVSRETIGVAIGLLMYRYRLDRDAAFNVLRRLSSHRQLKLREVAQQMVDEFNDTGVVTGAEAS